MYNSLWSVGLPSSKGKKCSAPSQLDDCASISFKTKLTSSLSSINNCSKSSPNNRDRARCDGQEKASWPVHKEVDDLDSKDDEDKEERNNNEDSQGTKVS